MSRFQDLRGKLVTARELLHFLGAEKRWWLIPMVVVLLVFGVLFVVIQGSAISPFIYALF